MKERKKRKRGGDDGRGVGKGSIIVSDGEKKFGTCCQQIVAFGASREKLVYELNASLWILLLLVLKGDVKILKLCRLLQLQSKKGC